MDLLYSVNGNRVCCSLLYLGLGITMLLLAMTRLSDISCLLGDSLLYAFRSVQRPWLGCIKQPLYQCVPLPKSSEHGVDLWSESANARLSSYIYWRYFIRK